MTADVTVDTSELDKVPDRLRQIIFTKYAGQVKSAIRNRAKQLAHYDTGNMRNLIQDGPTTVVGSTVIMTVSSTADYAGYEEYRKPTKDHPEGHAYMRPALEETLPYIKDMFADAVKEAFQ